MENNDLNKLNEMEAEARKKAFEEEQKKALEAAMEKCVWAPGIPVSMKEEDKLTAKELLDLATDFVVRKYLLPRGFKLESMGSEPGKLPNIIAKKDGVLYAIAVVPSIYPNYQMLKPDIRIKFVNVCKEHEAKPLAAPVAYKSIDEDRAAKGLGLRGDVFQTAFNGFIELTDAEDQNLIVRPEELIRP